MKLARASFLLVLAASFPAACAATSHRAVAPGEEHAYKSVRLYVDGMTCPTRCPREVRDMLGVVEGFVSATVDVPSQTVVCEVASDTDPEALVRAIRTPYRAKLL